MMTMNRWWMTLGAVLALSCVLPLCADAQTSIPRRPEGTPDMSGIWQVLNAAAWDLEDHNARQDVPAGVGVVEGGAIPYQPWAAVKKAELYANRATADPLTKCHMPGVPRITYLPYPFQIVQQANHVMILYEFRQIIRNVYLNSKHPEGHIDWYMGDSRGRWEGDTLVVDVVNQIAETWFDKAGNFHSGEGLHVVERYSFLDQDHLNYEATIEDPTVFTRPWKIRMILYRRKEPNVQLLEYECWAYQSLPPD